MNQAERARYKPVVLTNSSLFSPKTIELGGKAVEGTMLPVNYFKTDPRRQPKTSPKNIRRFTAWNPTSSPLWRMTPPACWRLL